MSDPLLITYQLIVGASSASLADKIEKVLGFVLNN